MTKSWHHHNGNPVPCHPQAAFSAPGTAIVLTTPDANRTFLSYLGEANDLQLSLAAKQAISTSRIFVVEGYMWEAGNALATISAAADAARCNSAMIVLTAGDAGVVQRHRQDFWQMINAGIDMLFCNKYVTAKPSNFLHHCVVCCLCLFLPCMYFSFTASAEQ